jgi:outer membrane protein
LSQAKGSLFPTIAAVGTHQVQETPQTGSVTSSPSEQQTAKITATQPLFRGLREFAGLRYSKKTFEGSREALEAAKNQLYVDVADAFYTVILLEKETKNLMNQKDLLEKRSRELRQRIKIGRSRLSEGFSLDSTLGSNEAQILEINSQLKSARESLSLVTGLATGTQLSDENPPDSKLAPLQTYIERIQTRPDLRAARAQVEAAEELVSIAKGGHLPTLDLNGNYYLKRPGLLQDVHWDVQLVLTVPIFSGGITQSQVSEASSKLRQAELTEILNKRAAESQIRSLYDDVTSYMKQIDVLTKATASSEKDYQEQLREYRLGLVNNLQVLQVQANFRASQLALERARYSARVQQAKLSASTGGVPR